MSELMNLVKAAEALETNVAKTAKRVGSINLKLGDVNLFTQAVWESSNSKIAFKNELNELAKADKAEAAKAIKILLGKVTVEVTGVSEQSNTISLAELLK